jgi:predicted cupin superfamily sugar epimerase
MVEAPTAADVIARLELKPHPEGGHYRETFRDTRTDTNGRAFSTAIYFLLARGERAHWHIASTPWRSGIITRAAP